VLLGLLFFVRGVGLWPGDSLVWPALLVAGGLALVWQRSSEAERASAVAFVRGLRRKGFRLEVLGRSGRVALVRIAVGIGLFATGISIFLATSGAGDAARRGFVALLVVVAGLALTFAPWWRRLARELAEERRERIRSQERAELAAHLHDSVLQTLALIQRQDDSEEMVKLARRQERELRAWLYGGGVESAATTVAGAMARARTEVEDRYGVRIEVVSVGDAPLDERLEALVKAAREAMTNAARLSGASEIAVYLEVDDERATAFVRDRGAGFDLDAVPPDRKGIAESIVGRMHRYGGAATIRTTPGEGTDVELSLPLAPEPSEPVVAGERHTAAS
jgi:signal transduction histidine kinase